MILAEDESPRNVGGTNTHTPLLTNRSEVVEDDIVILGPRWKGSRHMTVLSWPALNKHRSTCQRVTSKRIDPEVILL